MKNIPWDDLGFFKSFNKTISAYSGGLLNPENLDCNTAIDLIFVIKYPQFYQPLDVQVSNHILD